MPVWSGKCDGKPCTFTFDEVTAIVTPSGSTPIAFDLGDIDRVIPGEWDVRLELYTGQTLLLGQFGAGFSDMCRDFLAAWRQRTIQCLLLEDLEETARYTGTANGAAAEIRIFQTNLAILPLAGRPMQWRLAEIDNLHFDNVAYAIVLESAGERLVLSKLAKKTDEVFGKLRDAIDALHTNAAQALRDIFPFLPAGPLGQLQRLMPEGRSASLADLAAIDPQLPDALIARAVDEPLRPYFDALRQRATGPLFAGFKFVRASDQDEDREEDAKLYFFWFFFPLPDQTLAWEATTGTGRATYFFHSGDVRQLTRGLALINFRREPIYLSDASLDQQPHFHRYAIGARKLPDLRALRAAFARRAIHTSLEAWTGSLL